MDQAPTSTTGTYIYCIAPAQPFEKGDWPFTTPGIGGPVRLLTSDDLAAVVSDATRDDYTITRENLLAHQRVIMQAMTRSDVLPVSFGTVAESDQQVHEQLLRGVADDLHRALATVQGCIELELKVLWNEEQLFAEIMAEDDDIRALQDSLADQPPEATQYERIQLGQLVAAEIQRKSEEEAAALLEALEPLAVETRVNDNLGDMMLLNAAFLVDRSQEQAFDAQVQALSEAQAGRLIFQYAGPLPPYNFVAMELRWEEEPDGAAV